MPDRLLLIQSRWMGDVLLCTPAIRALRESFPHAHLTFLSEEPGADALAGNPHLDEVLVLEGGAVELQRQVRARAFTTVIDFRSTGTTARVTGLSGAPMRIGWRGRGPRNLAYTHLVRRDIGLEYVARQKLRLLSPLGIDWRAADASLEIAVGAEELLAASRLWERHALDGKRVVAVSPVSRTRHKQWGFARWAEVADAIAASGATVLLASGPGEADQLRTVAERMAHPVVVDATARSVRELAAVYRRCELWTGNDGGLKHVAAASGTPAVTVCRWQQSGAWSDLSEGSEQWALEAEPPGGCDLRCDRCAHLACLQALTVERVVEKLLAVLAERSPAVLLAQRASS
jgi:ADP-heptose:LPS heptosyltransferase